MVTLAGTTAVAAERRELADALEAVGPDAPTLADPWTASELAAHVVSLDRLAGTVTFAGRLIAARGVRLNDVAGRFADRSLRGARRRGFAHNVERLRSDPPSLLDRPSVRALGLFEVVVHHEDVRRANGLKPRACDHDLDAVVAWLLRYQRRLIDGATLRVRAGSIEHVMGSGPELFLTGEPREVVLWLAGRRDAAVVAISGDEDALQAVTERRIGV